MTRYLGDTKLAALRAYQDAKEEGATDSGAAMIAAGRTGVRAPATVLGWVADPDLQSWEREARLITDAADARAFVLELLALDLSYACRRPTCSNLIEWRADQPPPDDQFYCCRTCETEHHAAAAERGRISELVGYYLRQCGNYYSDPGRKIFGPELLAQLREAHDRLSLRSSLEARPATRRRRRVKADNNNSRARGDFSVACPTCEAPVGEKCKSSVQHVARVRAREKKKKAHGRPPPRQRNGTDDNENQSHAPTVGE